MEAKKEVLASTGAESKNRFKQSLGWQGWSIPCRDKDKAFRQGHMVWDGNSGRMALPRTEVKLAEKPAWEDLTQKARGLSVQGQRYNSH